MNRKDQDALGQEIHDRVGATFQNLLGDALDKCDETLPEADSPAGRFVMLMAGVLTKVVVIESLRMESTLCAAIDSMNCEMTGALERARPPIDMTRAN